MANQPSAKALEFQKAFGRATALAAERARRAGITPVGIEPNVLPQRETTVSLKQLAASLAVHHELPKRDTEAILGDLVTVITTHLKKGDRIRLAGLGVLVVRKRAARTGRNPATGEPVQIKASKKVAFRPATELKDSI